MGLAGHSNVPFAPLKVYEHCEAKLETTNALVAVTCWHAPASLEVEIT